MLLVCVAVVEVAPPDPASELSDGVLDPVLPLPVDAGVGVPSRYGKQRQERSRGEEAEEGQEGQGCAGDFGHSAVHPRRARRPTHGQAGAESRAAIASSAGSRPLSESTWLP